MGPPRALHSAKTSIFYLSSGEIDEERICCNDAHRCHRPTPETPHGIARQEMVSRLVLLLAVGLAATAAPLAAGQPSPPPPLSGLCADTPAVIDGNPRIDSGDYVTWNQSGIAGHDYKE